MTGLRSIEHGLQFDPLPSGFYRVGMFDYPWKFSAGVKRRPQHYPRMSDAEIAASNPIRLFHPDGGWLLMWCTGPKAQVLFRIVDEWQRRYGRRIVFSTRALLWLKLNASHPGIDKLAVGLDDFHNGQGLVSLKNAEDLWAFKIGPAKLRERGHKELLIAPRREHSRKPDESFDRVRLMFRGPYVEVFSRQPRQGWDVWGDDVHHFEEKQRYVVR